MDETGKEPLENEEFWSEIEAVLRPEILESEEFWTKFKSDMIELRKCYEDGGHAYAVTDAIGKYMAVLAMARRGQDEYITVPGWLFRAMAKHSLSIPEATGSGKGRHARYVTRWSDEFTDLIRSTMLLRLREQDGVRGDQAFEQAAKNLRGTPYAGTKKAIKDSLARVRRNLKKNCRYYYSPLFFSAQGSLENILALNKDAEDHK